MFAASACGAQAGVSTLAGNGTLGYRNGTGGPNGSAEFYNPNSVAVDANDNVYVADTANDRIRRIDASGTVTTFAGDNGEFDKPLAVAVGAGGTVYVADVTRVFSVDPSGTVTTLAGSGSYGDTDGQGGSARFDVPAGVAVDAAGNVYVADAGNNRIRRIDPLGNVTTLAGNGSVGFADGTGGATGTAEFCEPTGVAVDAQDNVYVSDRNNDSIRKIDASGNVTTVAGQGATGVCNTTSGHYGGFADGTGGPNGTAEFFWPNGLAIDGRGNIYVADEENCRIRVVDSSGNVSTLAGNGTCGYADGTSGAHGTAEFDEPMGVAVDGKGDVYVADIGNARIRKVSPE